MNFYTSYFSKLKSLEDLGYNNFVAVSGYIPTFYSNLMNTNNNFRRIIELAPQKAWFFDWKNGKFTNDDYAKLYNETVLNKLNVNEIAEKLGDKAVMLCYEKSDSFCHRHLIADWLNKNNYECNEIKF